MNPSEPTQRSFMQRGKGGYVNPYVVGVGLGLTLLLAFYVVGRGLGASGAMFRAVAWTADEVAAEHVDTNEYLAHYAGGNKKPLHDWLIYEVLGMMVGGLLSAAQAGRLRFSVERGPHITDRNRILLAFLGGGIMGFAARLARGCTSGQGLTGGATLAFGSWGFLLMVFVGAYGLAYLVRKQWI
ncbi:MAG: YeeE/YedE thiosulfate transporter family protein [Nitrospirota bacterium]